MGILLIIQCRSHFQETTVSRQHFCSPGSPLQLPIGDLKNSSVKFGVILGQRPNTFPSASHQSYLKHQLMSACSSSRNCACHPHLVPCPPARIMAAGVRSCTSVLMQVQLFSAICFPGMSVLPDSAPPLRLLLSVLKYQSLPYEVRGATPAVPARQGNAGISSVWGVRISLSSSLSAKPCR